MRTPHRINRPTNSTHPHLEELIDGWTPAPNNGRLAAPGLHRASNDKKHHMKKKLSQLWSEMIKSQGIAKNNLSTYEFWNISRLRPPSPMIVIMTSQRLIKAWTRSSPPKAKTSAFLILGGNFLKAAAFSRSLVIALGGYSWLRYIHNRNPGSICQVCESPTSAHDWTFNTWNGMGVDQ